MKRKIVPIAFISLFLGFLFDYLFYGKMPGISVFVYAALVLIATAYLTRQFKMRLTLSVYVLMPVILFFAFMVCIRTSGLLLFFNVVLVTYLLLLIVRLATQPQTKLQHYTIWQYFDRIPVLPFRFLNQTFQVAQLTLSERKSAEQRTSYKPYIRGIALSLPFLLLFLLLLSSADLIFKKYVDSIFNLQLDGEVIFRVILVLFVASLFVGAYALIFMRSNNPEQATPVETKISRVKFELGATEATIILSSISALFFIFVAIQVTYLFDGSSHVSSTGYTYAEYARKGFFELIAVAVVSMLLIWAVKKTVQHRTAQQATRFKWLSGVLIIEVMVIMVSAHMRLSLYEAAYGFTMLRLFSHLFIVWLAAALLFLLSYIIRDEREHQFAFRMFISVLAFFAVLNFINPEALIAKQNINRFMETGELDLYYLSNLSEDATPAVGTLLNNPNPELRKDAAELLYGQSQASKQRQDHWQSANLARHQANQLFHDKEIQLQKAKDTTDGYMQSYTR